MRHPTRTLLYNTGYAIHAIMRGWVSCTQFYQNSLQVVMSVVPFSGKFQHVLLKDHFDFFNKLSFGSLFSQNRAPFLNILGPLLNWAQWPPLRGWICANYHLHRFCVFASCLPFLGLFGVSETAKVPKKDKQMQTPKSIQI